MRTRIRCHSTGTCHVLHPTSNENRRSVNLQSSVKVQHKDVVIVGNGPSAITLSYFLSGHWPYYNGADDFGHPADFLHDRLQSRSDVSLVLQDLKELSEGLEGRSSNPVALLYDILSHPDADTGQDFPSLLNWRFHPEQAIDHVVLGRGPPGGSWQAMDGDILTISRGVWMQLANLSFRQWEESARSGERQAGTRQKLRASVADVAHYYQDYVDVQGLATYFRNGASVTCVRRVDQKDVLPGTQELWQVTGHVRTEEGVEEDFHYVTPNVVLATGGFDLPNRINVAGEHHSFVIKSLAVMEQLIASRKLSSSSDPVLIVGAGLSAADAIIAAHFHGIPIVHAFRRKADDPSLIFRQLPCNMYPEYHKVYQMMKDHGKTYSGYIPLQEHQVTKIDSDGKVSLQGANGSLQRMQVSYVVVLIGARPNLSFLEGNGGRLTIDESKTISCRTNPLDVDLFSLESNKEPGLYAMGPLVADNFVRFAQGGALAITNQLHHKCAREKSLKRKKIVIQHASASISCDL